MILSPALSQTEEASLEKEMEETARGPHNVINLSSFLMQIYHDMLVLRIIKRSIHTHTQVDGATLRTKPIDWAPTVLKSEVRIQTVTQTWK